MKKTTSMQKLSVLEADIESFVKHNVCKNYAIAKEDVAACLDAVSVFERVMVVYGQEDFYLSGLLDELANAVCCNIAAFCPWDQLLLLLKAVQLRKLILSVDR